MAKLRMTLNLDEDVMRSVRLAAARTGRDDSEVIEDSLRRDLGLDLLDRIWARGPQMSEEDAMALAIEAQRAARRRRN